MTRPDLPRTRRRGSLALRERASDVTVISGMATVPSDGGRPACEAIVKPCVGLPRPKAEDLL